MIFYRNNSFKIYRKNYYEFFFENLQSNVKSGFRFLKFSNIFIKSGFKLRIKNIFYNLALLVREYFGLVTFSIFSIFEVCLIRLESVFGLRKPKVFKKKGNKNLQKKEIVFPYLMNFAGRMRLSFTFLFNGVRLRMLRTKDSLIDSLFKELICIFLNINCFSLILRRKHMFMISENRINLKKHRNKRDVRTYLKSFVSRSVLREKKFKFVIDRNRRNTKYTKFKKKLLRISLKKFLN